MTHQKPTQEELEAQIKETQEKLEEPEKEEVKDEEKETPPQEPEKKEEPPKEEEKEDATEEEEKKEDVDYKKKFSESSREALKIRAKDRRLNKGIDEAINSTVDDPTEEELASEFTDWDVMSETEKKLAKETVKNRKFREHIAQARSEAKKIEKWNDEVDKYTDDPQTLIDNPALEGKLEEFKVFATEEENNSVPFKLLVSAFLYKHATSQTKKKGKMIEVDNQGGKDITPKSDKISLTEAQALMKTDYRKYVQLLKAGKIDMNI